MGSPFRARGRMSGTGPAAAASVDLLGTAERRHERAAVGTDDGTGSIMADAGPAVTGLSSVVTKVGMHCTLNHGERATRGQHGL